MKLFDQLKEREEEILTILANGYENKVIARELVISIFTVQEHVQNLFDRLGLQNWTQAARKYWQIHAQSHTHQDT